MGKIGRYEIVGPLATGGMAEIHLARLSGPSGFERPVVVKRLLPEAAQDAITESFLQEARLVARIRHANIVHVEDLGTDGDRPFLVMEYLEGESVANLMRRLLVRNEKLAPELAAFIIAEAAAGLHAAHELHDNDDKPLGLVHRDLSPNNVFVTYAGAVKVIDFGIAKQTSISERTSPGIVRGTMGYLAPEYVRGEPIDRRADIFALGILLYELLTGHRLFKRFTVAATVRAIVTDPITPPSRLRPDVSPALESVCLRALARDPGARFATAADLRRELLVVLRSATSEEPAADLSALMKGFFAERIEEKRALLRNVEAGSSVARIPVGEVDLKTDLPEVDATSDAWVTPALPPALAPVSSPAPIVEPPGAPSPPAFARPRALAAIVLLSSAAAIGLGFLIQRRAEPIHAVAPPAPAASEVAAPVPSSAPPPDPTPNAVEEAVVATSTSSARPVRRPTAPALRRPSPAPRATPVEPSPPSPPPPSPPEPTASARGYHRFQ